MRYSLLRYFYTEIFKISIGKKGAFFKPVFFEYYSDKKAYEKVDESFMLGEALIVYPVFNDSIEDIKVYIPKGDWYTFPSGEIIRNKTEGGEKITLSGDYNNINIFMRGGYILPFQDTFSKFIPNTHQLHEEFTELIIIPDSENYSAKGELIFDDDSYDTLEMNNYYHINIKFKYSKLDFDLNEKMTTPYNNTDIFVSKLRFLNMKYLLDKEEKYDILIITNRNGKITKSALIYKDGNNIEADLTQLYIRFNEISKIEFGQLKYKSNTYL